MSITRRPALLAILLPLVAFISFGVFSIAHAQTVGITALDITMEFDPENPRPNEQVTANLISYTVNLNNQDISWFVNRQLVKREAGLTKFTFNSGDAGSTTTIEAQIIADGQTISKVATIQPSAVDILWETNTYVPPFYKGKKLPTRQSDIVLTAMPQFENPSTDSIRSAVYYWTRNFQPQSTSSGYSKQSFAFENSPISPTETIGVTVKNRSETEIATQSTDVVFGDPFVVFYEKQGSRIFDRKGSLAGFQVTGGNFNLLAVPYFFAFDRLADVQFDWKANEQSLASSAGKPNEVAFELPDKGKRASISLDVTSTPKLLQKISKNLELIY